MPGRGNRGNREAALGDLKGTKCGTEKRGGGYCQWWGYLMAMRTVNDQTRSYCREGHWHFGAISMPEALGEGSWHSAGQFRLRRSWRWRNSLGLWFVL